jgi:hypothetical protein
MRNFARSVRVRLNDPIFTTKFHKFATFIWILLLVPSILWWSESVQWLVLMSVWANIAGHWSAYQASRAEEKQDA